MTSQIIRISDPMRMGLCRPYLCQLHGEWSG